MKIQNLKVSSIVKSVVALLFLILISVGGLSAQSIGETPKPSPSGAELQMSLLLNRRVALAKIADNVSKSFGKMPAGGWEIGKLIADGKREYQIALIEVEDVEQMNLALTPEQKKEIADHKMVYKAAIEIYGSVIANTAYKEGGNRAPEQGNLLVSEKYNIYLKALDPLRTEIDTLAAEIKQNTENQARLQEIYARIEQNSLKILAVNTEVLKAIEREPNSADKDYLKQYLEKGSASMKTNLEAIEEQKYFALRYEYDTNIELLKPSIAAFDKAQTNDERRKLLIEMNRISEADKAIAQKVIAGYLKYADDQTVWAKLLAENENNLKYIREMKLKYSIEF